MKLFFVLFALLLFPAAAGAYVTGMDDQSPNISDEVAKKLDDAILTYYKAPSYKKVETVLDIMNDSDLLRKKTAWPPMVGFLTIVFSENKERLFAWMARHDYNEHAQKVFLSALSHARLYETAAVFAQAHQWKAKDVEEIRQTPDHVDFKHLVIQVPGHIDTLWGAFFASGDPDYIKEIIDVVAGDPPKVFSEENRIEGGEIMSENKKLAESTLRHYARNHEVVRQALSERIAAENDEEKKQLLKSVLGSGVFHNLLGDK